ncbi:cell division protein [Bacillus mangrovi]|uniref:Cell division protein n=2 Tax=Metabacillus mangrovi TaxID=1491830 RepID=A0A7X2S4U1_9BACI|nr:PDZ domain-containing protein [Metabacillus mangrovi]MTH53733.1 cell division protein [Metabacillus mangrovi]
MHPLVYYFVLYSLCIGFIRIKKERESFYTKTEPLYEEVWFTYLKGLPAGLAVSAPVIAAGISIPFEALILIAASTFLLSLAFSLQLLSAAFTIGTAMLGAYVIPLLAKEGPFADWNQPDPAAFAVLIGLLLAAEGILIYKTGHHRTSPSIIKSSRGLPIGRHTARRLWMLPVVLFVPGGTLASVFSWWPVFEMNGQSFSLFIIPFFVGFSQSVQGSLPKASIQASGKRIVWLACIVLLLGAAGLWWTPLSYFSAAAAAAGRIFLLIRQKRNDRSAAYFFSKKDTGLIVLGLLPNSPSEKMGIQVGETISKVNGTSVKTTEEFYKALQKNRALCKLEIYGHNGEIRYVQRATYEGDHHELGLLFVEQPKKKGIRAG